MGGGGGGTGNDLGWRRENERWEQNRTWGWTLAQSVTSFPILCVVPIFLFSRSPLPAPRSPFPFPRSPFLVLVTSVIERGTKWISFRKHYVRELREFIFTTILIDAQLKPESQFSKKKDILRYDQQSIEYFISFSFVSGCWKMLFSAYRNES